MLEIPKIVRQRMAAKAEAGAHPDANLLTAFAEQTLLRRERDSILQHLSQCTECREAVFLAAPQEELRADVIPARSSWLGWPGLRWGALAACTVIVVGAVSLRQRSTHSAFFNRTLPEVAMKEQAPAAAQSTAVTAELEKDRATTDYKSRADVVKPDERVFIPAPRVRAKASPLPAAPARNESALVGSLTSQKTASRDLGMFAKPAAASAPAAQPAEPMVATESSTVAADSVETSLGKAKQAV